MECYRPIRSTPSECKAITRGTENHCDRCGFVWDIDDPDPPECKTLDAAKHDKGLRVLAKIQRDLRGTDS